MLTRLSRNRRWLVYPSLIVWWLWSTMALCYAQSFAAAEGAVTQPSVKHTNIISTHEQHEDAAAHVEHGATATAHDCCGDPTISSCCDVVDALKIKSTSDTDLQFVTVLLSWLFVLTEPALAVFPTVDTVSSHAVIPRRHLLLSVFLD